jgi:hypothetical protein
VVEVDAGDDHAVGVEHVDRVQPAAQAHFQDHQVQRRLRQRAQDDEGGELEPGQRDVAARGAPPPRSAAAAPCRRRHLAVDAATLLEVHQVRLAVQPHAVAGLARDGLEHGAGRALAVGAGHHDHRAVEVHAQAVAHAAHAVQRRSIVTLGAALAVGSQSSSVVGRSTAPQKPGRVRARQRWQVRWARSGHGVGALPLQHGQRAGDGGRSWRRSTIMSSAPL